MSTLNGHIKSFSLAAVNRMIHSEKKTGRLAIESGPHQAEIYYQKGLIVFLDSDLTRAFSLGQLVRTHNIIDDRKMRKALEKANSEGRRLGVTLVRLGYITKEKLINLLHYQYKEVIATVLAWRTGSFSYTEGLTDFTADIRFEIDPVRLITEAQKWRQYRDIIPDDRAVFKIGTSRFLSDSSFSEGVLRVMLLIDGQRTIMQIIAETGFTRLAVYKAVKQLVSRGAIERKDTDKNGRRYDLATLIKFYLDTIDEVLSVISLELGLPRALDCLQGSLYRVAQYEAFLNQMPVNADSAERFKALMDFLENNPNQVPEEELITGFDSLVNGLLLDLQQLLGERAYGTAMERIDAETLANIKNSYQTSRNHTTQPRTNDAMRTVVITAEESQSIRPANTTQEHKHAAEDQVAELEFFSGAVRILAQDLESEIGQQADAVLQGILENSDAYPLFLNAYQVTADNKRNADLMAAQFRHTATGYGLQDLEDICRGVLADLVAEIHALLGSGAAGRSLDKVEEMLDHFPDKQRQARLRDTLNALRQ